MVKAVKGSQAEKVQALLDAGEDVNASAEGFTALIFTAVEGHTNSVQLLLDRGADVNANTYHQGMTPLMEAIGESTENVKTLDQSSFPKGERD